MHFKKSYNDDDDDDDDDDDQGCIVDGASDMIGMDAEQRWTAGRLDGESSVQHLRALEVLGKSIFGRLKF
ncbi:hypothetical protein CBR_g37647 [Chara braunii]|uniref:Uncharacterized protein n=1 Tax=Chara braunii TaxID=69332 RepID=A0A388LNF5_CHABU|nr:hypothetical protein CBR_g37647 [Chara braunii]|eukprot:GBG83848.1 hypothetical protein CBR_g37647 [Chara braunii]